MLSHNHTQGNTHTSICSYAVTKSHISAYTITYSHIRKHTVHTIIHCHKFTHSHPQAHIHTCTQSHVILNHTLLHIVMDSHTVTHTHCPTHAHTHNVTCSSMELLIHSSSPAAPSGLDLDHANTVLGAVDTKVHKTKTSLSWHLNSSWEVLDKNLSD